LWQVVNPDRALLTVCGSQIQADVLVSQLALEGIDAQTEPAGSGNPLETDRLRVVVPSNRLRDARRVLDRLEGRSSFGGLLDFRRLLPAVAVLVLLITVIVILVELILGA
jgi:hypothetical protein